MMKNSFIASAILAVTLFGSNLMMGGIGPSRPALSKEEATKELFESFFEADPARAKVLVDAGADVNARHHHGKTPLHLAAERGYRNLVIQLIDAGADVNTKIDDGTTPLHLAAVWGQEDVARELVLRGADPCIKNKGGKTPLDETRDESVKKQIEDARREFEQEQRELRERLTTLAVALQRNECPRDVIREIVNKAAEVWGVKKAAEMSGKDESSSAPSSLSSFAGHSKASVSAKATPDMTADREE